MTSITKRAIEYLLHNRLQFFDSLIRRLNFLLPDKLYLSLRYRCQVGRWINWKSPKTFTEKIQWLKVYGFKSEYTSLVDKYAVKDYVSSKIGAEYIIPTIGVWECVDEINWDELPPQFVLKTTHGGGGCGVVICSSKADFNRDRAVQQLSLSMQANAGKSYREHPYDNVPCRIIAEKFMKDSNVGSQDLSDYKFFCFGGEPMYCQVIRDRHTKETIDFYDMEWKHMPFVGINPIGNSIGNGICSVPKPQKLQLMIEICRKLSAGIPFLRVDLYIIDDDVYFGELTFYPASGLGVFTPKEWDSILGEKITCC